MKRVQPYAIVEWTRQAIDEFGPMTVRMAYYYCHGKGVWGKAKKARHQYQRVSQVLSIARRAGLIGWDEIWSDDEAPYVLDREWWAHDVADADALMDDFVHGLFEDGPEFHVGSMNGHEREVFIIVEHAGLVPAIRARVRDDVRVISGSGQPSTTLIKQVADVMVGAQSPIVLTIGDHDTYGQAIIDWWREDLTAWGVDAEWRHIGLTAAQIKKHKLTAIEESKKDENGDPVTVQSVQIEALPPDVLWRLITDAVDACFDSSIDAANDKQRKDGQAELDKRWKPISLAMVQHYDDYLA